MAALSIIEIMALFEGMEENLFVFSLLFIPGCPRFCAYPSAIRKIGHFWMAVGDPNVTARVRRSIH